MGLANGLRFQRRVCFYCPCKIMEYPDFLGVNIFHKSVYILLFSYLRTKMKENEHITVHTTVTVICVGFTFHKGLDGKKFTPCTLKSSPSLYKKLGDMPPPGTSPPCKE